MRLSDVLSKPPDKEYVQIDAFLQNKAGKVGQKVDISTGTVALNYFCVSCGDIRTFWSSPKLTCIFVSKNLISVDCVLTFQNVHVHRTCAGSSFGLCRRTYAEHRQELHEKLCVGMPGGCNHRLGLHHLLGVCLQPSCCRSECSSGFYGVELHRRADFQHAHSGRRGENGRPACEGDDGHLRWQSVY